MPSFRSRFTASRSYHGNSVAASLLHLWSLKQVEPLTYQICAHQAFACRNRTHRHAPRPPARKTQKSGQPKASHASTRAAVSSGESPTRRLRCLTFRSCSYTCATMTASSTTDLRNLRLRPSYDLTRAFTRLQDFWHLLHVPVDLSRAEMCCWCHLTSPDNVITPRQQPRKHVHVSSSPRHRHVIGWRQWIHYSTSDPTRKPGTNPDRYPLTLNLDQLTLRWPLTKSQNFR